MLGLGAGLEIEGLDSWLLALIAHGSFPLYIMYRARAEDANTEAEHDFSSRYYSWNLSESD